MLCQPSDKDHQQTSDVHANHPNGNADTDTEMTSNDSTGSYTESPSSSSSTASPISGSFKAAQNTQIPCCSRPRIATKAPQAAPTLPPLSSTLQQDIIFSSSLPDTDESTATTTTPYRFCTSCDTFMGFSPDATLARRKSSILEPIRLPNMAVNAPAPPLPAPPLTRKTFPPQQGFRPAGKPKQMQQQQQQCRPSNPSPAPTRFSAPQRPGRGSMDPPPLQQRKRLLEPSFEGDGGEKRIRWVSPTVSFVQILLRGDSPASSGITLSTPDDLIYLVSLSLPLSPYPLQ
ncbi:MAG: hypothetical protein OHK93_005854 [Ramalina farinacea]|uniref:Uncharacterized protein n=1 Tax=Ramalina farinacea TaxID=258253 RepID=A0AA43QIZ1_9LECA|nr:hypothetical protein [Ramalina farinacea]